MVDTLAEDGLHFLSPEELTTYQHAAAVLQAGANLGLGRLGSCLGRYI